jgi:hypothetical protein
MAVHQENPKTPPRDSGAGTDQDKVVWRAARNLIAPPPLDDLHCEGKGLDLRGRKKRRSEEIRERSEKKICEGKRSKMLRISKCRIPNFSIFNECESNPLTIWPKNYY